MIEDSREGWVQSVGTLLQSYFGEDGVKTPAIVFDYSHIRKSGEELKTYGGKSSGPDPLIELHKKLRETLDKQIGSKISSTTITDIFNLIGRCVIGIGNIRAAEIAFGEVGDTAGRRTTAYSPRSAWITRRSRSMWRRAASLAWPGWRTCVTTGECAIRETTKTSSRE